MNRILTLLGLVLAFAIPAAAQDAGAKLYAKAVGDDILVAVKATPEFGCWFYDQGEDVGGLPTVITIGAIDGATWTDVWFPKAKSKDDGLGGTARVFTKKTVFYAAAKGAAAAGVDPKAVTARIEGQVCNTQMCVPWELDLTWRAAGNEELWKDFPAALLAANVTTDAAPSAEAPASQAVDAPVWHPIFGDDKALARAYARADDDGNVELVVQVATPEHWHMYHGPTVEDMGPGIGSPTVITVEGGNVDWEDAQFPRPFEYVQMPNDPEGWLWAHEGTFHFGIEGEAFDDFDPADVKVTVLGQSCDPSSCVPIELAEISVEGTGNDALYAAAFAKWELPERASAAVEPDGATVDGTTETAAGAESDGTALEETTDEEPADGEPAKVYGQKTDSSGLLGFVLLAIGAGLFTLLMPCTYPMIPITISYFTKQAENRDGNVLSLALLYGLGIVAMFVLLAVVAAPIIVPFAMHPVTNIVIGTVFVVFALALFGAINLNPPAFLLQFAGKASSKGGYVGVFLMGLTLVVTSFTCTGPFVGSLIAAGAEGGIGRIVIGMAAFGATMATPFVFLALVPGRLSKMPSAGGWMNTLKVFMGFVELAASLKFFSNADIVMHWGIIPREVFLVMWAGIAFIAGYYLLGRINLKGESSDGEIGPGRLCAATATILGGFYCLIGVMGYQLDGVIMSAMAPPPSYTRGLIESHQPYRPAEELPDFAIREGGSIVVVDDYDAALGLARERNLGLLVNFTAHT